MNINVDLSKPLKSHQAFAVKTSKGTWFTVYSVASLENVINEGDFELICYRRIG
jgi:hypothetical protein